MRRAIAIGKGKTSYGAYVPNLPGCVAVGETIEEVRELIQEVIRKSSFTLKFASRHETHLECYCPCEWLPVIRELRCLARQRHSFSIY